MIILLLLIYIISNIPRTMNLGFSCEDNEFEDKSIILPEKIIVQPNRCVNISLEGSIFKLLEIKIHSKKPEFSRTLWMKDFPLDPFNYFYSRYLHDVGHNWITLCNLDHFIVDHSIQFIVETSSTTKFYYSSDIKIACKKYSKDVRDVTFPENNKIFDMTTFIYDFNHNITLPIKVGIYDKLKFLRFSVCWKNKNCHHISVSKKKHASANIEGNTFYFLYSEKRVIFDIQNYELSGASFHIIYRLNDSAKIVTTTLIYKNKILNQKILKNSMMYIYPEDAKIIDYQISAFYSTNVEYRTKLIYSKNLITEFEECYIICTNNSIIWNISNLLNYIIVYVDLNVKYNDCVFTESHFAIIESYDDVLINIDLPNLTTSLNLSLNSSEKIKGHKANFSIYFKLFVAMVSSILLFIILFFIIYECNLFRFRKQISKKKVKRTQDNEKSLFML